MAFPNQGSKQEPTLTGPDLPFGGPNSGVNIRPNPVPWFNTNGQNPGIPSGSEPNLPNPGSNPGPSWSKPGTNPGPNWPNPGQDPGYKPPLRPGSTEPVDLEHCALEMKGNIRGLIPPKLRIQITVIVTFRNKIQNT